MLGDIRKVCQEFGRLDEKQSNGPMELADSIKGSGAPQYPGTRVVSNARCSALFHDSISAIPSTVRTRHPLGQGSSGAFSAALSKVYLGLDVRLDSRANSGLDAKSRLGAQECSRFFP